MRSLISAFLAYAPAPIAGIGAGARIALVKTTAKTIITTTKTV